MKRIATITLAILLILSLFAGCSGQNANTEITETTTVLYVEKSGFIAKISGTICYVEYVNADSFVTVGAQVELTYLAADHLVADNDRSLGGYQWTTVLTRFSALTVK